MVILGWPHTHSVRSNSLKDENLLLRLSECRDYSFVPPCPVLLRLFLNSNPSFFVCKLEPSCLEAILSCRQHTYSVISGSTPRF